MAAIATSVYQTSGRIDASWRLRAGLFVVALLLHAGLIGLIKSHTFVLRAPAVSGPLNVTIEGPEPESVGPIAVQARMPAVTARRPPVQSQASRSIAPPVITSAATERSSEDLNATSADLQTDRQIDGQLDVENLEHQAVLLAQDRNITGEMPHDRLIHAPTAKEKLTEAINQAERPDCHHAYAGLGIIAIPFLVENTVTGTGCKW